MDIQSIGAGLVLLTLVYGAVGWFMSSQYMVDLALATFTVGVLMIAGGRDGN